MNDLQERIATANPIVERDLAEDDLARSLDAAWRVIDRAPLTRRRVPGPLARTVVARPRRSLAFVVALVAAVALTFAFSGGPASAPAEALPILATATTDLSGEFRIGDWLPGELTSGALKRAHAFPIPDGRDYVVLAPGGRLCLLATATVGRSAGRGWIAVCGTTAQAEQGSLIFTFGFVRSDYDYIAFVPSGGHAQLTKDGTTTQLPVNDGIAAGDVHTKATLAIRADGATYTRQIGHA